MKSVYPIALGAKDNEVRSYLEIVDALRMYGARPQSDINELWRRIVFTILISNDDDHMRNHGFLYAGSEVGKVVSGWRVEARQFGLSQSEIDRMATAFEHDDLKTALNRR